MFGLSTLIQLSFLFGVSTPTTTATPVVDNVDKPPSVATPTPSPIDDPESDRPDPPTFSTTPPSSPKAASDAGSIYSLASESGISTDEYATDDDDVVVPAKKKACVVPNTFVRSSLIKAKMNFDGLGEWMWGFLCRKPADRANQAVPLDLSIARRNRGSPLSDWGPRRSPTMPLSVDKPQSVARPRSQINNLRQALDETRREMELEGYRALADFGEREEVSFARPVPAGKGRRLVTAVGRGTKGKWVEGGGRIGGLLRL